MVSSHKSDSIKTHRLGVVVSMLTQCQKKKLKEMYSIHVSMYQCIHVGFNEQPF